MRNNPDSTSIACPISVARNTTHNNATKIQFPTIQIKLTARFVLLSALPFISRNILWTADPTPCSTPPNNKGPICTVPDTTEQHGHKQITVCLSLTCSASAKRNINIIPKPGGQTNMPSTPKIRRILGKIQKIKILSQIKIQNFSNADCHVGISRKITVNLK